MGKGVENISVFSPKSSFCLVLCGGERTVSVGAAHQTAGQSLCFQPRSLCFPQKGAQYRGVSLLGLFWEE